MLIRPERVKASFIQYDKQPIYKDTIIRIVTSEKVFFFYHSQFENVDDFLNHLKPDIEIIIGGYKLKNGGGWLHWAILDENNELKPEDKNDDIKNYLKYVVYSSIGGLVFFFMIIEGVDSPFIAAIFLFLLFFCGFFVK